MKKFFSVYGRGGVWMAKLLSGCTLAASLVFLLKGEALLIGGLFAGYLAGGIFCWSLTNRMEGRFDQKKAEKQLQRGFFVRFGSLCVILSLAAQVSRPFFFVSIAGYILFLALAFACLVASRVRIGR